MRRGGFGDTGWLSLACFVRCVGSAMKSYTKFIEGFPNSFLEKDLLSLVCVKCRPSVGAHAQGFKDSALPTTPSLCVSKYAGEERGSRQGDRERVGAASGLARVLSALSRSLCRPRGRRLVTCSPVASPGAVRRCCFSGLAAGAATRGPPRWSRRAPPHPGPAHACRTGALSAEPSRFTGMFRSWVHSRRQLISLPVEVGSASRL